MVRLTLTSADNNRRTFHVKSFTVHRESDGVYTIRVRDSDGTSVFTVRSGARVGWINFHVSNENEYDPIAGPWIK